MMSKDKQPSTSKSNRGCFIYYPSNIFHNKRDLPVCHANHVMIVNWLPRYPRLSIQFETFEQTSLQLKEYGSIWKKYNISVKGKNIFYSVKDKKDTQKRQVVDMNKIIAFKKVCTEAAVNSGCFEGL